MVIDTLLGKVTAQRMMSHAAMGMSRLDHTGRSGVIDLMALMMGRMLEWQREFNALFASRSQVADDRVIELLLDGVLLEHDGQVRGLTVYPTRF